MPKTRVSPNIKHLYYDLLVHGCVITEVVHNFTDPTRIRDNPTAVIFVRISNPKEPNFRYIQRYL